MEGLTPGLTPKEIVAELDKYIIGQAKAKRMVGIALRTRWRRRQLDEELRDEVMPRNIIMVGPTGVGKTEISRRLAKLAQAPFLKIEASKFTEVGYVGRDVESMIREITELSVNMVKSEQADRVSHQAEQLAEERILDILLPPPPQRHPPGIYNEQGADAPSSPYPESYENSRQKLRKQLREGKLNERMVELEVKEKGLPIGVISNIGMEDLESNLREMFGGMFQGKKKKQKVKIPEALKLLVQEEAQKLIDMDDVVKEAIRRVEEDGIIFLDEIDKIAVKEKMGGPDISREGVQRDLLPIVEGSTVNTKFGMVKTDHILFIAAGAFHMSKPSDLIPELQGRFPLRVELDSLGKGEFIRILTEPKNALIKQYVGLMETEGIQLEFTKDSIEEIAKMAVLVNERMEDIGARRLFTIMENLLDELSFDAPDLTEKKWVIDAQYVQKKLKNIVEDQNLSKYIL